MNWFTLSLLSVTALATAELTQQHLLNKKNPFTARTSAVLTFLFQSFLTLPIIFLFPFKNEFWNIFQQATLIQVILVTMLSSVSMVFYLKSFQVKNISLSAIFISFSVVVSTILGIIFFQESTNFIKIVGIVLILLAIISLNYKNAILEKNHFYGLLAGLMIGVQYVLDKSIVLNINPLIYVFWAFFLVALFGFIFNPKEVINSIKNKQLIAFKLILYSGVGYLIYNILTFFAYVYGGEVGKVDAINNSQIFLIIIFEYFVLKHTDSLLRKFVTALVAFSGVCLLGVV